jgi:dUTP pyrophosphatase
MLDIQVRVLDDRLGREFPLPSYATEASAGLDLRAMVKASTVLEPATTTMISSGLSIYLRDPGFAALVVPRSGLGSKSGIVLGNLVGVIDADYQGPLMMPIWNRSNQPFTLNPGDRVAQLLIVPVAHARFHLVDAFEESERGAGGFGSTGLA